VPHRTRAKLTENRRRFWLLACIRLGAAVLLRVPRPSGSSFTCAKRPPQARRANPCCSARRTPRRV